MRILVLLIVWSFLFLISTASVCAMVFINEVSPISSPEWVELYNTNSSPISLRGYSIDFGSESQKKSFCDNETIDLNGYKLIVLTSNWLNNLGDVVNLKNGDDIVDSIGYGSGYSLAKPRSGTDSITRYPDGSGNWIMTNQQSQRGDIVSFDCPTPTPTPTTTESSTPTATSTSTKTPTPSPAKSIYKINESKDQDSQLISSVKIYVDNLYTHHEDDEILEFCDGCYCDDAKTIQCGYGEHTIKLTKTEYSEWSEQRNFSPGANYEVTPIFTKIPPEPSNTITLTTTPTLKATTTPTPPPVLTKTPSPTNSPSPNVTVTPPLEKVETLASSDSAVLSASISAESDFSSANDETNDEYLKPLGIMAFAGILFLAVFWRLRVLTRPIG